MQHRVNETERRIIGMKMKPILIGIGLVFIARLGHAQCPQVCDSKNNTALGDAALPQGEGASNTALGYGVLGQNTGGANTGTGTVALSANMTGSDNTAD